VEVRLPYGTRQRFRRRTADITIRGTLERAGFPVAAAWFRLNDGPRHDLYVEQEPDRDTDWVNAYKATPAELRCREQGEFCVEIANNDAGLRVGANDVVLAFRDSAADKAEVSLHFDWDPEPLPLPLDLRDLRRFASLQDVGQVVNGAFDLDHHLNVIRSRSPAAPDALLVLGSPHGSQEATYGIRFLELSGAKWLGCSDFFAGMTQGVPARGIKVGWCSAGMAALSPSDGARAFIAWGDHSGDPREWAIATHPAASVRIERHVLYRVRHQITLQDSNHRVRWRIWPDHEAEPASWTCMEESAKVPGHLPRHQAASFALFQHMGHSIEWSDIVVHAYAPPPGDEPFRDPAASRVPFLQRNRPGAF
jgi:hypothetical protein